ncbi:hypothetical protein N7516_003165 [Penicillium verrucosum]|uniref:uncharacterized protein n=1 Tax=Penicillium verrucosum TaxID=60171 RepID=UPI00254594D3|nr:uncharacterized protein N7516_003165 [Penicillium verrucosum]KAJ5942997.1 hypothetical protein N7516_003165 [Penicillium verrucosum]
MPPKPSSRKGVKKGVSKTESSAETQPPSEYWNQLTDLQQAFLDGATQQTGSNPYAFGTEIKTEIPSPTPASVANDANEKSSATPANETTNGNVKNTKSEFANGLRLSLNQFPCTVDDMTLFPCPNYGPNYADGPTFSSQNGRWEWIFLPSNIDTESSPPKVKMEDIPEANPRVQRPSNPVSTTFSIADLDRFAFSYGAIGSDDDISPVPSLVENIAEQARTAKHVRFFMNTTHDKHFVPIEVPPLTGNANWGPWLAAMRLLFRQHSVWPIVTSELQPLSPNHNLYLWYQRMCDCAVALIYANVSEEVRRTSCFMSTAHEDDADVLMSHLYAHYSEPGSTHSHEESELD